MSETGTSTQTQQQIQQTGKEPGSETRTFTQDEVNRIVQERLARVKAPGEPSAKELELQQRENTLYIREQIIEKGLPSELCESLKGLDKETADKCIEIISPYVNKAAEPIHNPVRRTNGTGTSGDAIRRAMGLNH